MKQIQPQLIWSNGVEKTATVLFLQCNSDNLSNKAIFLYCLYEVIDGNLSKIMQNEIDMDGAAYQTDWTTNDSAYLWAANTLGLVIVGDYLP